MTRAFAAAIFGCEGPVLGADEARFFAQAQPFGFILFARNVVDGDQLRRLCADLRAAVGWHAPVFIDQEGGRVQRIRPPVARNWLPPLDEVARFGDHAETALRLRYGIISAELLGMGIDGNCVPALDVARPDTHPVLRNRLLSDEAGQVARLGRAVGEAHLAAGVLPVIKHIPGHGRATMDSHLELPRVSASRAEIEADFMPFRALNDMPLAMSAHIVFDAIDDRPATVSQKAVRCIRDEIGFDGLLMTDDISMQALDGTVAQRAVASLAAGCDVVLHCNGNLPEMRSIWEATGHMEAPAQSRAEAALVARCPSHEIDLGALEAAYDDLCDKAGVSKGPPA